MKRTLWKRMLALALTLMLATSVFSLAEDVELILLPEQDIAAEDQGDLELDAGAADVPEDLGLDLGLDLDLSGDESIELSDNLLELDDGAEAEPSDDVQDDGALADNAGETVSLTYIDAKGKQQGPVNCNKLKPGNENRNMGDGWYAVTENISYSAGIIVFGKANLILCDGATLTDTDGIWVQEKASLTIWAQSHDDKMGKLVAHGGKRKAGIGGIENEVAGPIVINGGDIEAKGGEEGAGIGSGYGKKSGFTRIEINGGKVTATGCDESSGIGKAEKNKRIGDIVITGGKVQANGGTPDHNSYDGTGAIEGNSVTIDGNEKGGDYVQAVADRCGAGIAGNRITINGGRVEATGGGGGAGIGGNRDKDGGRITINGGRVKATGGLGGAGIGGGYKGNSGHITINGGSVTSISLAGNDTSTGDAGAGIGGGHKGDCMDVTINGGTVEAVGGVQVYKHQQPEGWDVEPIGADLRKGGAGIGGGMDGDLIGTVYIKGGTVKATGKGGGAGIGAGLAGNSLKGHVNITGGKVIAIGDQCAAGIGGGREGIWGGGGEGSNVNISGNADVYAESGGGKSSAIGHGENDREYGTLKIADNMMVQAGWTEKCDERKPAFTAGERVNACMYRWYARITPCKHPRATYIGITEQTHTLKACIYCGQHGKTQAHSFGRDGKCTVCGYQKKADTSKTTVTFHSNGGTGRMAPQKLTIGKAGKLNANTFTCLHHTFKGWNTEPDGSGVAYADQAQVELKKELDLYAIWYTNVTLVANSKRANWTGKPVTVEGYHVRLESGSDLDGIAFPGVSASRTETEPGSYPVKVKGAKVNETTDKDGEYLVKKVEDGELVIEKVEYKITFDANGGKGEMGRQKLLPGKPEALKANAFTWEGHTFKGWNTKKDGSGKAYADKAKLELTGDITLYAQWYTHVTLVSDSLTVEWDGELHAVRTFKARAGKLPVTAEFPDIRVIAEERSAGAYPVEFRGVKLNKTTDRTGRYLVTEVIEGKLTIEKKAPKVVPPRAIQSLVYNGRWQRLVEPGRTDSGELKYSLDQTGWSANVPRVKDAGAYTVYYKSFGDENRKDSELGKLTVQIAPKPLNVAADQKAKYVGDPDPELTYWSDSLEYGDEMTGKLTRDEGEKVGQYLIRLGTLSAGKNYDIRFTGSWLIIRNKPTPKPTVTPKPTESDFTLLAQLKSSASDADVLALSWTKAAGAKGYDIFFASADSKDMKLYRSVGSGTTKLKITGLKKGAIYKACVKAWKRVDGAEKYFGKPSPTVYAIAGGADDTYCDAASVRLSRSRLTLKSGDKYRIRGTVKGMENGKALLNLESELRFYSSNPVVATVSETGEITAVDSGSCTIYALANNGVRTSVRITVK